MSAPAGAKAIKTAIETRTFDPVYYLYGDDDYLKDESTRRLLDAAIEPSIRDFNLEIRRAGDLDAETLESLLSTPPMMAERRAIVVRDVGALKKDVRAMLERYLNSPAGDVLLILTTPSGAKADAGLVGRATTVEFKPLSGAQVPKWITFHVEQDLKSRITPEAVTLLVDAMGGGADLAQLRIELDKLVSYAGDAIIDESAVSAIVGVRRGETLGDLLDALAQRDAARGLALLPHVLQQPKTTAVSIVMALATQTLALAWGRAARDRGVSAGRLESEFFGLLKSSSAYTGRGWGEAVRSWAKSVDRWTAPELDRALEELLRADSTLKDTRLSSDEQLLTNLVLTLCGAPRRRAA
jgi:DNA polymerase III subunit delta